MSRALSPHEVAFLAQAACLIEASAPKPGNVSREHDFRDTRFEDFLLSAAAIGPAFQAAAEVGVGETVWRAVAETRRRVRVNTNLGIILLLAPLARAAGTEGGSLRDRLSRVLKTLTLADARGAVRAIRLAEPGGLGRAEAQDVRDEPTLALGEIMSLAADRDTIAREYVTDYDVTFGLTVPALKQARAGGLSWPAAAVEAYLSVLAEVPDTLIARKQGILAARAVSAGSRQVLAAGGPGSGERAEATRAFDAELRGADNQRNPGTTADLVAAGLFVALSEEL